MLPHPRLARFCIERTDWRRTFRKSLFHAAAHSLQQRGHIQKIVRRSEANFVRELSKVSGKRQNTLPRKTSEQKYPGGRETKRSVVENAVRFVRRSHQLIEPFARARQHVRHVANV